MTVHETVPSPTRIGVELAAIDEGVPIPVLASALFERFSSQGRQDFADRVLSAMRKQFGGHAVVG